jgi:hypothetical protein
MTGEMITMDIGPKTLTREAMVILGLNSASEISTPPQKPQQINRNTIVGELPGSLYPLERYNYRNHWAKNPFDMALYFGYCDGLGLPPVCQHKIFEELAVQYFETAGKNFAIAGTGGFGLEMASLANYGMWYGLADDGCAKSHNVPANDRDFTILDYLPTEVAEPLMFIGLSCGAERMLENESLRYLTPYQIDWSHQTKKTAWGVDRYLSFSVDYFQHEKVTTLELHHQNLANRGLSKFFNRYQPWSSTIFGSPISLSLPDQRYKGGLKHFVYNPVEYDPNSHNNSVYINSPETFIGNGPFCIPQVTRIAYGALVASLVAGIPAEVSSDSMKLMRQAVNRYAKKLTPRQEDSLHAKLQTAFYKSRNLQRSIEPYPGTNQNSGELTHLVFEMGDFQIYLARILDSVGYGKLLGQKVEEFLEENPV